MIDNVVLIVTGTLHERDVNELLEKCHPLGMFDRYSCGSSLVPLLYKTASSMGNKPCVINCISILEIPGLPNCQRI